MGNEKRSRREFLRAGAAALLAGAASATGVAGEGARKAASIRRPSKIPNHLPDRLAISCWQFTWISCALPDEPYHDLEAAVIGLKERGFNAVRLDAGYDWCFTADGKPRGEMEFRAMIGGQNDRIRCKNGRGGARFDVLQRVIRLMELAKKHGVYVIPTCWQYMHSNDAVADPALRNEIAQMPKPERLMRLTRNLDRLLQVLKERGLHENLAYVEPHNEVNYGHLLKGPGAREAHEEAIAFLRERHPDILVAGDTNTSNLDETPRNTQILDNHVYPGVPIYWENLWRKTVLADDFDPENPRKNELLDFLLEKDCLPFDQFDVYLWEPSDEGDLRQHQTERRRYWLWHNLDLARFDRWMLEQYAAMEARIKREARERYTANVELARSLNVPAVISEGGLYFPPLNSRWEESETGRAFFDHLTDLAIELGYWGFLQTTYNGPDNPMWWAHAGWLKENNTRFLRGERKA